MAHELQVLELDAHRFAADRDDFFIAGWLVISGYLPDDSPYRLGAITLSMAFDGNARGWQGTLRMVDGPTQSQWPRSLSTYSKIRSSGSISSLVGLCSVRNPSFVRRAFSVP